MEYTINLSINGQCLTADKILSVNGTVDIIRCNFTFEGWDDFPARVAIFQSKAQRKAWVASLMNGSCLIPWEALVREGEVLVALVGTNTDGQVQRTETKTVVLQKKTLQGGVNSITPTPDQYAQFIAQVEEIIGQAGVLSVNGMTGDVTLTYSDVNALPDSTVIPTKTSDLQNDSGFITSIPSEYVTDTELQNAISGKANSSDLATVATTGDYDDLTDKPVIPNKTSQLQNDSGFITSAPVSSVNGKTGAVNLNASDVGALPDNTVIPTKTSDLQNDSNFVSDSSYVHTDNNFTNAEKTKLAGIEAGAEVNVNADWNAQSGDAQILNKPTIPTVPTNVSAFINDAGYITSAPVSSVNTKTGAVVLSASDVGALPDNTTFVSSVNGSSGAVIISTATTSSNGLMSSTDKSHLDSVYADYSSALQALGV